MFGLSFLYPFFLAAVVAAAIPVILHLFRRRTETVVDFPAVRLLQKAPVEHQRRRRLRELILLALRVAALVLLAFAFARPFFRSAAAAIATPVSVVALDESMSMSAPAQFESAKQLARQAIADAPGDHLVSLVTFSDSAAVLVPPTTDRGGLIAAVDSAAPTAGGTRFRTALGRAAEAIGASAGRIVVVTDLQQSGWETADEGAVPDNIEVEVREVRAPEGNLAVTALRREGEAVIAAVHNFGSRPMRTSARLRVDGKDLDTEAMEIPPQSAGEVRLVAALPTRGGLEVRIDDPTGYQADNARYLVLDPAAAVPVVVITAEPPSTSEQGLYIERALGVAEDGTAFQVRAMDGRQFSTMKPGDLGEPGAIVVLGTRTLEREGRDRIAAFLKGGGRVLLTLGPDVDLDTLNDTVGVDLGVERGEGDTPAGTVTLIAVDARHPIFRPFSSPTGALGDVYVGQYRRLKDQGDRTVLARFSGGAAALTEQAVERGRLLVFSSDLDNQWNRFPLNPAFVPFALESVKYLTQGRAHRRAWTLPETPPGIAPAPGIYSLPVSGPSLPERRAAVNVDVRESNPARTSAEGFTAGITRLNQPPEVKAAAEAKEQEERQRLWQLGLLAMLVALAGEGLIGRKAT
jgi:Aerotolerance regulator N-terminal/von Willebrand factor type A domain